MIINIKSYPAQAQSLFDDQQSGSVHSVFDNTVNIIVQDCLYALSSNDFVHTPMSILFNISSAEFQKLTFNRNDQVCFNREGLSVNGYFASRKHAIIHNDVINPFDFENDKDRLTSLQQDVLSFLKSFQTKGEMVNALKALLQQQHEDLSMLGNYFFDQFQHIKAATHTKKKVQLMAQLIGAGQGLTPSGDDFISGVLASLHYTLHVTSNPWILDDVVDKVTTKITSTTRISQEYLRFAMEGQFNAYVHQLFEQHQNNQPVHDSLQKISTIGHSSGSDFLVGMYFGLEIGGI